jgi:translocation and assembly module TamA
MRLLPLALLAAACFMPWAAAVGKVEIDGVRGALRDNVFAHLALDDAPCDAPSWRVQRLRRQADGQVRKALEAFGFYNPRISIESPAADGCWLTRIAIDPGDPVRLRRVDVNVTGEAKQDPAFARLLTANPLRSGEVLDHAAYDRYKRTFADLARERGYFAGAFSTARLEVHAVENAADVTLGYDSGPRYRFGPVTFEQAVVRPGLVERFVDFRPGDLYDGILIEDFYNALLGTGYFASVDLRTQPGVPPDITVPVSVALEPAKRKVYTAGVGYGTDIGPKLRAGYIDRRVNDRGHQFDASMSLSEVLSEVGVSYRFPRQDPRVEWLSLDGGYQYKDTDTSRQETWKTGVKEFRRRRGEWIETRFVDASTERFKIAGETTREFLLVPGMSWSHKQPNSATVTRPERGHRVTLKVSGTAEWIGSDSEFLQGDLYGKLIWPLWSGARVLLRGEIGATAKEEFRTLPASVRYFAGGDYSVRGYDYETLGPTDAAGNVVGGSHRIAGSVEIDQRVLGNWSVAAFADSGNAFDSFSSIGTKTGIGGGLRWYSPLGPVRVDVAFPLDKDAPDDWRLHVTLGPDL